MGGEDFKKDLGDLNEGNGQAPSTPPAGSATLQHPPALVPSPTNPMAVARMFVNQHYVQMGQFVLRVHRGDFHRWSGTCWPEVDVRAVRSAAYSWLEDAQYLRETKAGAELVPFEPTRYKVDNVVDALRAIVHLDGSVEAPAWIDGAEDLPPREVVSVANGLLHVPTRTLLPHRPAFFVYHSLPFEYDPIAPSPGRWLHFLSDLWGTDEESIQTLQEIMGEVIGGDTRQQKIFLFVGPRRGGKGTIGRVLTGLLGKHNVAAPTLAGLATNFGLQELIDRPLGLISDARLGSKADSTIVVERLLSISGEDSITVDRKYKDPWTGRLPTRFVVLTNELPRLLDSSGALSSRFVLLVLTKSFLGAENPKLTDELLAEAPGILNWVLEGLDRLHKRGHFRMPTASEEALVQLEDLSSPVAAFLRDRCEQGPEFEIAVEELWSAWKDWCVDENRHPGTKANFGKDLKATAPTVRRMRPREVEDRVYLYAGIRLATNNSARSLGPLGPDAKQQHPGPGTPTEKPQVRGGGPSGPSSSAPYSVDAGAADIAAEIDRLHRGGNNPHEIARTLNAWELKDPKGHAWTAAKIEPFLGVMS